MDERWRGGFVLTTERSCVDLDRVHAWLSEESYWAAGREREVVVASIEGSLPYSVYRRCGFSPLAGPDRWMEIDRRTTRAAVLEHTDPATPL